MMVNVVLTVVRGFAMGAADLVPGVSGGTVALIFGIYERLIASVSAGSAALVALAKRDVSGFRERMGTVEWAFVLPLVAGILLAIVALASLLEGLLHDEAVLMAAVFVGLVAGSVIVAWRLIREPRLGHAGLIAVVGLIVFFLLGFQGGTSEESVAQADDPALWMFFVAGAIAICAMILPGISGSFLLVIMGMYGAVLASVTQRDLLALAVFLAGAVVGLALFSQLLDRALRRHHDVMLAGLIGLMAGSIRVLWPWPNGVDSTALEAPGDDLLPAILVAAVAFGLVFIVATAAQRLELREEAAARRDPAGPETAESAEAG
jgi:putative membrane protein